MLDGPVPDGARSVSWPWYHHVLTNELTVDARALFEEYAKVPPKEVEDHIYRIVSSKAFSSHQVLANISSCRETKRGGFSLGHASENFGSLVLAWPSTRSITIWYFHV